MRRLPRHGWIVTCAVWATVVSIGHVAVAEPEVMRPVFRAALEAGDSAWSARAETIDERLAAPDRIESAIAAYRSALEAEPDSMEARWKLLRALHYAIDFTRSSSEAQDARVVEAIAVARAGREALEARAGSEADRARLHFWSAIAWGTRAQRVGLLTIVREGVATRMHDDAEQSLVLDPSVDRGGALRLLSRLHGTLPRVPFVSGWVDRDRALELAERGQTLDPDHPGTRLILALTLLEQTPERTPEARALLESVVDANPRPDFLVEDLAIREQARERLAELDAEAQ